jgi:hypothetical protein
MPCLDLVCEEGSASGICDVKLVEDNLDLTALAHKDLVLFEFWVFDKLVDCCFPFVGAAGGEVDDEVLIPGFAGWFVFQGESLDCVLLDLIWPLT